MRAPWRRSTSSWPARRSRPTSPTSRHGPSGPAPTTTARSSRTSATGSGSRRCERFIETSGVAAIAAELMGSRTVRLYHDHVLVKEPGTRQRTPWHQDQPYYNVDGRQNASMWLPGRSGAARRRRSSSSPARTVASGTCPARSSTTRPSGSPTGSSPSCPTSTAGPDDFRDPRLGARARRRRVLPHAHAARRGRRPRPARRRVLSVRFLGDDIAHAPRPWTTSPPFDGLADELPAGAAMDHPLFPILWPAGGDLTSSP